MNSNRGYLVAPKQTGHAAIRIPFKVGLENFEVVGFLREGEESCLGEEALRRADNGYLVRTNEDWEFFNNNRDELPRKLRFYWLATARPNPDGQRRVSGLDFDGGEWCGYWLSLDYRWSGGSLVVRRRVS